MADDCEAVTAGIMHSTGAAITKSKQSEILFAIPDYKLSLTCGDNRFVNIAAPSKLPPNDFFDIVGAAGSALTGDDAWAIRNAAMLCQRKALSDKGGYVSHDIDHTRLFCTDGPREIPLNITIQSKPAAN